MKQIILRTGMFVVGIALLFACSDGDNDDVEALCATPLQFITQMDAPLTRATADNTWTGGELVQVVIDGGAAQTFTAAANDVLTPNTAIYWQSATQTISAWAWHPASWTMQANQGTTANFQAADFIFAPTVSGITQANYATTPLVFRHRTAKVTANLAAGGGISAADIASATVRFYGYTSGTANTADGSIQGSNNGEIAPLKDGSAYTALLIPQNIVTPDWFIQVTIGGNDYLYKPAPGDANLEAGRSHTYNITVTKGGLNVTVVNNGAQWGAGSTYNVTGGMAEGSGTVADPYNIYTVADMQKIGNDANWTLDKHYKLMEDLTLNDWTPIGNGTNWLSGTFDGNGHTLTLTGNMPATSRAGVFSYVNTGGVVRNLKVSGTVAVSSSSFMEVYAGAIAGQSYGVIENCAVTATVSVSSNNIACAGGIVGNNRNTVRNCYSTGNISAVSTATSGDGADAGGITGINAESGTFVYQCYSSGTVAGTGASMSYGGGITGSGLGTIQDCVALGTSVSASGPNGTYVGRIAANKNPGSTATNVYANADMSLTGSNSGNQQNGADITSTQWSDQSWWSGTAGFSFGTSDASPWVFNDGSRERPVKLWWE